MKYLPRILPVFLLCLAASSPAVAGTISWEFSWQKVTRCYFGCSNFTPTSYSGNGTFSYDSSAADDELVTNGGIGSLNIPDELTSFSFSGYRDGALLGQTNALPGHFSFAPSLSLILALNNDGQGGIGLGCLINHCSIDGERHSGGFIDLNEITGNGGYDGDSDGVAALPEPGTLALVLLGMLSAAWFSRRKAGAGSALAA